MCINDVVPLEKLCWHYEKKFQQHHNISMLNSNNSNKLLDADIL
ncbi:MAG: hypothetical protein ACI90V_008356 [Bacillariaceae sp.]|jgi:hypothetical protein